MTSPPLSIIIPSYNGAHRLSRLMAALAPQLAAGDEVLLVDDCSTDATADMAVGLGMKVVRLMINGGAGRARNEGARAAAHDVLCFFDDDVVPAAGYLATVREVFSDPGISCAQGSHALTPLGDHPGIWERADAAIWHHYETEICVVNRRCQEFYSGATCIRRSLFTALGGFREDYQGAGGEEFDFGQRLLEISEIHYVAALVSFHQYKSLGPRLSTLYKRARNYPMLVRSDKIRRSGYSGEKLRLGAVALSLAAVVAHLVLGWPWLIAGMAFAVYLWIDRRLYAHAMRNGVSYLIPAILASRYLQYAVIGAGAVQGELGVK